MKVIILLLFCLFSIIGISQETTHFVQFKVQTINSVEDALELDKKMSNKSGITKSRSDYKTSTYFCILKPGTIYNKEEFTKWFYKLGYVISCYNMGIQGQDRIISPYELNDCEE